MTNEALFQEYARLHAEVEEKKTRMNAIRTTLSKMVDYRKRKIECGRVRIVYSAGYKMAQWDKRKLADYACRHPEILEFRLEKRVKPRRSIFVR